MYQHLCICTHVYVYAHLADAAVACMGGGGMYASLLVHMNACMHTCVCVCVPRLWWCCDTQGRYVFIHIDAYVCMQARICMYICVCVCVCVGGCV